MQPLAIIAGPTAVGKSELAVEVAGLLNGEIISADSMQVYLELDIGTAKLNDKEKYTSDGQFIRHHLIDLITPDNYFSVADYKKEVESLLPKIYSGNKLPTLVGGTGLYIEAVIDPYEFTPLPADEELRKGLRKEAQEKGNDFLHQKLAEVDPTSANQIHPNDLRRIIRALEVYSKTGMPISIQNQKIRDEKPASTYTLAYIGLYLEREHLYQRINARVDQMLEQGLVEEVKYLLEKGYSPDLPALQGLGYKQIVGYLKGFYNFEEAVRLLKRDTRRYAKRQLTWFKRDKRIKWYNPSNYPDKKVFAGKIAEEIGRTIN